ncbi:hypothetical protein NJ76_19190 [Rhodococcus sp. IITR03]|nr:hypothetical protein NJ76_19190 [Rhodococcus sp. IITR03]
MCGAQSFVTSEFAPITAPAPMLTPGMITAPEPIHAPSPMVTGSPVSVDARCSAVPMRWLLVSTRTWSPRNTRCPTVMSATVSK